MNTKPIIIVPGEPHSIFSEILFKSLKIYFPKKPIIIIGSINLFYKQMKSLNYRFKLEEIEKNYPLKLISKKNLIYFINVNYRFNKKFSSITDNSNKYIEECFRVALEILKKRKSSGLINGPISKKNFLKNKFLGITEYLKSKTKSKNTVMLIYSKNFSVSPITTHVAFRDILKNLSSKKIVENTILIRNFFKKYFRINPKVAIAGINPHCESKYKNNEESNIILPALKKLKKKFKSIYGPFPVDSLFMKNLISKFDVVLGMYHDQVLTPAKAINNFNAINITLGLPFIRISPDHGPNEKMQGKNISNPQSLLEAIKFLDIKCK